MLIEGAPSPRHPSQSCRSGADSLVLLKKYENRKSLTRVGRNTLLRLNRLWSTQATWRVHCDGYAARLLPVLGDGEKARLPSCEWRTNTVCVALIRPSRRTLSWLPKKGLDVMRLKRAQ